VASAGVITYLYTHRDQVIVTEGQPGTGERTEEPRGTGESPADDAERKAQLEREKAAREQERIALLHQNAYDAIVRGSERAAFVCMQLQIRNGKQTAGLQAARNIQNTNLEDQLRRQIEEHTANIADALKTYGAYLDQLTQIDPTTVTQEFDHYAKSVGTGTSNARQVQLARVMKRDYEARRGGRGPVNEKAMAADCAAALGGPGA